MLTDGCVRAVERIGTCLFLYAVAFRYQHFMTQEVDCRLIIEFFANEFCD